MASLLSIKFFMSDKKDWPLLTQVSLNLAKTWTVFLPAPWTSWSKTWAGGYLWTQKKSLSPKLRYFVANSRSLWFKRFLEGFRQKRVFWWDKVAQTLFLGPELPYFIDCKGELWEAIHLCWTEERSLGRRCTPGWPGAGGHCIIITMVIHHISIIFMCKFI